VRRVLRIVAWIGIAAAALIAAVAIATQTPWFKDWLRGVVVRQAGGYLNGTLAIDQLGGNLFSGIELRNVRLTSPAGEPVLRVRQLGVDYSALQLLTRHLVVSDIRIDSPEVWLRRTPEGWNIASLVKQQRQEANREGPGMPISIGSIGISDGRLSIDDGGTTGGMNLPRRIDRLDAKIGFEYKPVDFTVDIDHVSFRATDPAFGLNALSGRIATRNDTLYFDKVAIRAEQSAIAIDGAVQNYLRRPALQLRVGSEKVVTAEIARIVPALSGIDLQPSFEIRARGPLDRLRLALHARSSAGEVHGDLTTDVMAPGRAVSGTLSVEHLDLAPLLADASRRSDITARANVDLRLADAAQTTIDALSGTYRIEAPRLAAMGYDVRDLSAAGRIDQGRVFVKGGAGAYGARATVDGWIAPSTPLRLDVSGGARRLDLTRLPRSLGVPRVPTAITAGYHVQGTLGTTTDVRADLRFNESRLAGATIESGGTAGVTLQGKRVGYRADATVRDLDLQQIGRAFEIAALSEDRFRTGVNGHLSVRGSGSSLAAMNVEAKGTLTDSQLLGGRIPQLSFEATLAEQALHASARGAFQGFDPGALSGDTRLAGSVGGEMDLTVALADISAPVTPEGVAAEGRLSLAPSRVGAITIDQAVIAGRYAHSAGTLDTLTVKGPDMAIDARGRVDLTERAATDVTYRADLANLEPIARLLELPVSGAVAADGRLTGNAAALSTTGTLTATNLAYADNSVLSLSSKYTLRVPELDPARVEATNDTRATVVHVAGRDLTEILARTTWRGQNLGFDATVRDQTRELAAAADVVFHPDHQEVHVRNLALRTEGVEWSTPSGSAAAIQYGADRIEVQQLQLQSAGGQTLAVDGAFGRPGDRLVLKAERIDLSTIDRLLLGDHRLAGRVALDATLSGTREAPVADARFSITDGAFRDFRYQQFAGTAGYAADELRAELRLDQAPGASLTIKGTVPRSVFASQQPAGATAASAPASPARGMDVQITSSPLDLSLVQAFVPQVSKASGTFQADVRVTGTMDDPQLRGHLDVRNGAMTVADLTEGGYTGLDTRIAFEPERVRIERFSVLDEHRHALTIEGDITLQRRAVSTVRIGIHADQFEVVDNDLGEMDLNAALQVAGTVRAPRIAGDVSVHSGTIDVQKVLDLVTANPYAVEPTDLRGLGEPAAAQTPAPATTAANSAAAGPGPQAATSAQTTGIAAAPAANAPAEEGGIFDALTLDVRVKVPDNLVLKASGLNPGGTSPISLGDVNVTLGGDIHAGKGPGEPLSLTGRVNTIRGTYDFQGRRFDIERDGGIQFTGGPTINPRLDLRATRLISGIRVLVHIEGTARQPKLTLSSQPPQEEADILSLIIFNQPANSLGEGQQVTLAQRASALATGFVASSLAQSIGGALDLDVFEIQTTPESGGSPTVTLGEQVGERLFFKFRQAFGAQSVSEFILEYQIAEYLRLQSSVAQGATASQHTLTERFEPAAVDLIFYFTY
jgi:autotransporter translocation and assembly factor TamB